MSVSKQKDIRKSIALQLEKSLTELKTLLGDKKFSRRIKKASKVLTDGIYKPEEAPKETKVKKTIVPAFDKLPVAKKATTADTKTTAKAPIKKAAVKKGSSKTTPAVKTAAPKKQAAKKLAKAK